MIEYARFLETLLLSIDAFAINVKLSRQYTILIAIYILQLIMQTHRNFNLRQYTSSVFNRATPLSWCKKDDTLNRVHADFVMKYGEAIVIND